MRFSYRLEKLKSEIFKYYDEQEMKSELLI